MRIRANLVFVSCILHTVALLYFVRAALWDYFSGSNKMLPAQMDAGFRANAQTEHYLGICFFAIVLVALITTWTEYVNGQRSAWLVMFVIVWLWAFPLFILPFASSLFRGRLELTVPEFLYEAISRRGLPREVLESILMFSAMLTALLLPIRKFFGMSDGIIPSHRASARLVSFSVISILVVLTTLYAWIRVGVLYEIPVAQLNATHRLPAPPPPPDVGD